MDDLVGRLIRELPDTGKDRYDIAYERGRAQARSSLLFGGLLIGLVGGAVATFLLDPHLGRGRRTQVRQRAGALLREMRHRALGVADTLAVAGTSESGTERRADELTADVRPDLRIPPRSAAAPTTVAAEDTEDPAVRVPAGVGTARR